LKLLSATKYLPLSRGISPLILLVLFLAPVYFHSSQAQVARVIARGFSFLVREEGAVMLSKQLGLAVETSPQAMMTYLNENAIVVSANRKVLRISELGLDRWNPGRVQSFSQYELYKNADIYIFSNKEAKNAYDLINEREREGLVDNITFEDFQRVVMAVKARYKLPQNDKIDKRIYDLVRRYYAEAAFKKTRYFKAATPRTLSYCIKLYQLDNGMPLTGKYNGPTIDKLLQDSEPFVYDPGRDYRFLSGGLPDATYFQHFTRTNAIQKRCADYLKEKGFIPGKSNYSIPDVRIGLLKYQEENHLLPTSEFDDATTDKIISSCYPYNTAYPHWRHHVQSKLEEKDEFGSMRLPVNEDRILNFAWYRGLGFLSHDPGNDNYIICNASIYKNLSNDKRFLAGLTAFMDQIPAYLSLYQQSLFVFTFKSGSGKEYVTAIFANDNRLTGYTNLINDNQGDTHNMDGGFILTADITAKRGEKRINRVVWYGDDLKKLDVTRKADSLKVPILRRLSYAEKKIPGIEVQENAYFERSNAVVCNAVPSTKDQLRKTGYSLMGLAGWQTFHKRVNERLEGKFNHQITTKEALKKSLVEGDENMLLIVAHSDGMAMYIGTELVTLEEMKAWPSRHNAFSQPRVGILMVCDAGNANLKRGWLFKKRIESITEVMLNKGFLDIVIAPDHEINSNETLFALDNFRNKYSVAELRQVFKGWHMFVFDTTPYGNLPFNKYPFKL